MLARRWLFSLALVWFAAVGSNAQAAEVERPRLVVVVSIDQFPYEYLERMRAGFDRDGIFERIFRSGAAFTNCHHGHAFTLTGPGHSVLLTGAFPSTGGIIGNDWYDRERGKSVYCVADDDSPLVGVSSGEGISPRTLIVDTLGDVLKLTTAARSKVFGVAIKDRASVLMAGHLADAAFWFDTDSGNWISSRYYGEALHPTMRLLNESDAAEKYVGATWDLLLPHDQYVDFAATKAGVEVSKPLSSTFARSLPSKAGAKYYKAMTVSPYGNDLALGAALALAESEKLGQDEFPDILAVNLSSNDYIGHAFGPHSLEVQDMTYRTDRQLGAFADAIEKMLDGAPWLLAISSDHGVAPVPEYAAALGLDAKRVSSSEMAALADQIESELTRQLGDPGDGKEFVEYIDEGGVYLRDDLETLVGETRDQARGIARDVLLASPLIGAAFTRDELLEATDASGAAGRFRRAFHPRRSGDVLFALAPYHIPGGGARATHGSPWQYDTHVPLLFLGSGVRPGIYDTPTTPAAIAPTAAALLGVSAPAGCVVERLSEAIATPIP